LVTQGDSIAEARTRPFQPPGLAADPYATRETLTPSPGMPAAAVHGWPSVPGYEILEELGRGGMGVVYKARQVQLNRLVALKMILSGAAAGEEQRRRFQIEAEAVARLQHPHVVQIHEVGEAEGKPFFSLEFLAGGSLASRLDGTPLPVREAARLVETLARAVHYAHEQGIIHRDLKPANILLRRKSEIRSTKSETNPKSEILMTETPGAARLGFQDSDFEVVSDFEFRISDFEPKIADFGLAKRLEGGKEATQTGAILGTPCYMAPEQAGGKTREVGPATDVYALGVILYELLTGRPPFRAETPVDTLLWVLEREPVSPRLLNPKIDRFLEAICLKCQEKDPHRRYASAAALADDLNRYQTGEAISARQPNLLERLGRTLDRSQYDTEFAAWGTRLLLFAAIVFLGQLAVFVLSQSGPPYPWNWLLRVSQSALMALVLWWSRRGTLWPSSTAERQLWSLWGSYLLTLLLLHRVLRETAGLERPFDELTVYPVWTLLTGLAFLVMGSNFWGRCYLFGMAFLALGVLMPAHLRWAPLGFGTLWGVALVTTGLHLRRLGRETPKGERGIL
jgi:serine/threonine protein kinase